MWDARFVSRIILALLFAACGGFFSACADRHINLVPPTVIPHVSYSSPTGSRTSRVISIARPMDLRPDPTTVGNVRNGYEMVMAQVRSNNDVPMWVANSLTAGLEQAGYRVERVETVESAQTPVAIDIAVSRVFTNYTQGFFTITGKGDVAAQVEVYKQGQRIFRRAYAGKYETFALVAGIGISADGYQKLLDEAMKDFLQKAVPDLTSTLSRALEDTTQE